MSKILITGANRGIGLEMTRQLKATGHNILAVCRQASDALKVLEVNLLENVDVTLPEDIERLKKALSEDSLDIVINNAGLLINTPLGDLSFKDIERQMQVNAYGPLRISEACLPHMKTGGKIAMVTSRMGSIADNTSGGSYGYRMSKTALNMAAVSLAHDLKDQGISVGLFHPGFVRTEMTGRQGLIDADESAASLIQLISQLNLENTGSFWHVNGEILPW